MSIFEGLSAIEIVYWISAVLGGILFLFRAALFFIAGDVDNLDVDGGDFDGDFDTGHGDTDLSFKLLSLQGLTAFFMMFGLSGLAFTSSGIGSVWSILGGTTVGLFSVGVISVIFTFFKRLQSDGTLNIENAIGQTGTVYLRIQEGGSGQVQVSVQGGLKIFDARSVNQDEIPTGSSIKVVDTLGGNVLIVDKLNK